MSNYSLNQFFSVDSFTFGELVLLHYADGSSYWLVPICDERGRILGIMEINGEDGSLVSIHRTNVLFLIDEPKAAILLEKLIEKPINIKGQYVTLALDAHILKNYFN